MFISLWPILASLILLGIIFGILGEMSMRKFLVGGLKPSTPKMPRFGFAGLCLLVAFFIFAIQQGCSVTGNAPSWIWGTVWFLLAIALVLLAIWFWDQTASHHWIRTLLLSLIAIVVIGGFSYIPVAKQYRAEHNQEPSSPRPQVPKTQMPTAAEIAEEVVKRVPRQRDTQVLMSNQVGISDRVDAKVVRAHKQATPDATLNVRANLQADPAPYDDGTVIGGLRWISSYVDVRVELISGEQDIESIDATVAL
jgi:hypothetical protein